MKNYSLKNYKLIEDFDFDLNKLNIIVGENSSGKSSLLRSIQLLKQSLNTSFEHLTFNSKKGLDFGSYYNLLPNGENKEIFFGTDFENGIKSYGDYIIKKIEWSYLDTTLNRINIFWYKKNEKNLKKIELNKNKFRNFDIKFFNENFQDVIEEITNISLIYKSGNIFPSIIENKNSLFNDIGDVNGISSAFRFLESQNLKNFKLGENKKEEDILDFLFKSDLIILDDDLKFIKKGKIIDSDKEKLKILNEEYEPFRKSEICFMINSFINEINKRMKTMFNNISYTGAIRALGERYYRIDDDISQNDIINNDVSKKLYTLYERGNLTAFNKFISEHLNFTIELEMLRSEKKENIFYSINIVDENKNKKNLVDVGAGYSQILPILFACFGKEKNPETIIMIEQPELHLHPKMQSDLIDLFLKLSIKNPNLKLLIETHSNIIIDRIGKHIYKKNYDRKDVNLYIFNREDKLKILKTTYTQEGSIKEWPIRFFSAKEIKSWS